MITSFSNSLVKRIKRLRQKKYRVEEGAFFVEGVRVVMAAVEAGAGVEVIVYAPELLTSGVARKMVADQVSAGVRGVAVSAGVFGAISERENPAGLGAIVKTAWTELEEVVIGPADVWVGLVEIGDPGNLGTILRTVDATGAAGVILVGQTVDPFHPTAVKASMGTLFTTPISRAAGVEEVLDWAGEKGLHTIATSARARLSFWEAEYRLPALLLLGSEGEGLGEAALAAAEQAVTIPMAGRASSLNLAVAAGVLLYEMRFDAKAQRRKE